MKFQHIALATVAVLATSQVASAQVVDFEELTPNVTYDSPLVSGGLEFVNGGDPALNDGVDAFFAIEPGSNGTLTLAPNYYGSSTTVSAVGGALFTLGSFDFSDAFDFADDPLQVNLTFLTTGGTINETIFADFTPGMQTATFNIAGISSFSFTTSGSNFGENTIQLDNIAYSLDAGVPGDVPEPASWALMIAGFGLTGAALRRRSTKVVFAA